MCHIHVINIILWMECSLSGMLILEYLCKKSFSILVDCVISITLYWHSPPVNCIELSSDLSLLSSWASLASLGIAATALCNWWSLHFDVFRWTWYQILSLVTARLDHKAILYGWLIVMAARSVNWLPSIFSLRLTSWWSLCCIIDNLVYISSFLTSSCSFCLIH